MTDESRDYGLGLGVVVTRLRQPVRDLAEFEQKLIDGEVTDDDVLAFRRARGELADVLRDASLQALLLTKGEPGMEPEMEMEDELELETEEEWSP